MEITAENYKKALTSLETRFNVKTLMFESHIAKIFNLPKAAKGSANHLRNLIDEINTNVAALKSIGSEAEILDSILIFLATERLDNDTTSKWEENRELDKLSKWADFEKIVNRRCQYLEVHAKKAFEEHNPLSRNQKRVNESRKGKFHEGRLSSFTAAAVSSNVCTFCKKVNHTIYKCAQFLALSVVDRYKEVKRQALCINCLAQGHSVKRCNSSRCRVCLEPHHPLLHRFSAPLETAANTSAAIASTGTVEQFSLEQRTGSTLLSKQIERPCGNVILATAMVEVKDNSGCFHTVRALLDSASQVSFITENMAAKLHLKKGRFNGNVGGIGDSNTRVRFTTNTVIKSRINEFQRNLHLWVLPSITNTQPERQIDISSWSIPVNIHLADPHFHRPQKIDLLIGAEIFFELLSVGQIRLGDTLPTLQKTQLGWIVSGNNSPSTDYKTVCSVASSQWTEEYEPLENLVEAFWLIEDAMGASTFYTEEQLRCERLFLETTRQAADGRLTVKLPFKESSNALGDSLVIAKQRFLSLERRLNRNCELKAQYSQFLREYEELNHMELVSESEISSLKLFLPHQCVIRSDSSSTKLRVVFDGGCRTTSNRSLNDILMVGPTVQIDLFSIVFRCRFHKYALTADIVKMYRQIKVDTDDANFQCILWRDHPNENLKFFRLTTVTYGTSPAPFLATRCLNYLADKFKDIYSRSSNIIKEDFYVDNLISGANSLEDIKQIQLEVDHILSSAKIELKKWYSNHEEFLSGIPEDQREKLVRINDLEFIKTLGLIWEPTEDYFRFVVPEISTLRRITKRIVLSDLAKLFDPLGLINPVIVKGKVFLQELWKSNLDWDESLPQHLYTEWDSFRQQLHTVNELRIPRFVLSHDKAIDIQVHGFGDASMRCYGCCIYLRIVDVQNNAAVKLICAKSKVAPLKTRTLPELELCASYLLAILLNRIRKLLPKPVSKFYLWTDSSIVLNWLSLPPSTWTVFVANRVARIQELTEDCIWRHVDSISNPADIISRGTTPSKLLSSSWFSGSKFLYNSEETWPALTNADTENCVEGRRKSKVVLLAKTSEATDYIVQCKFVNNFAKLRHVFAYVLRFIENLISSIKSKPKQSGPLLASELKNAEHLMAYIAQKTGFPEERARLSNNEEISPKSSIKNLNPFLDRTPILIPKKHPFILSYVAYLHNKYCHAGSQALMNMVREKFWATNLREVTTKVVRRCLHCFRYRPKLLQQIMGDLPSDRVQQDRPFRKTGLDFCGTFWTKSSTLRGARILKTYVAVFVCFCTKAVHLEAVSDLSSKAFIAALHRFIGRRGLPNIIFCYNATNFVGARNELRELREKFFEQDLQEDIRRICAEDDIEFQHIPPRAPHFGGLWEAAVGSMKRHLCKTCGNITFTFEELSTILAQVEATLNSRPITPLATDPSNEEALTPGHFLIGAPLVTNLSPDKSNTTLSYLNRWNRLQAIIQHFWKRWSREYLLELQKRIKWKVPFPNVEKDTLVLVAEDNIPPQKWLMGRLASTISGTDRRTRVVDEKTKNGILRRPIHKIAPLPMEG